MTNPWIQHVKAYHQSHPHIPYGDCMSLARTSYGRNKKQAKVQTKKNKFDADNWFDHSSSMFTDNGVMTISGVGDRKYKQVMDNINTLLSSKRWLEGRFAWVKAVNRRELWRVEHNAGLLFEPSKWFIYHPKAPRRYNTERFETLDTAALTQTQIATKIMSSLKQFLNSYDGPFEITIQH